MDVTDLAFTSALDQAQLIRDKQVSPLELTQVYLERIERLDSQLGSFFTVNADRALAEAKAKTDTWPDPLPPFFGVPIAIKDLTAVQDLPCSYGLKVARDRITSRDDHSVGKLRQAGMVILGKTATSQLASLPYTEPPGFPPARNPWHLDYTPGGSSGGSAAAVAAGLCPIALGSDGGGSIRGPAACCGVVGLKPARGRISYAPMGEAFAGFATEGALAHTVADVAAFLDVTAGYVTGDPYWLPNPDVSFWSATQRSPGTLRVGYITEIDSLGSADPVCKQAVEQTAHCLESLGHQVEALEPPNLEAMIEPFTLLWRNQTDVGVPPFFLEKVNRWLWWRAKFTSAGRITKARQKLQRFAREVVQRYDAFDVLLLPTYLHPTIRIGEWAKLSPATTVDRIIRWIGPCPVFNVTGQPAISLPAGFDPHGLPIGIQLVGRPADELTLLSLAAQLEAARPWRHDRPQFATAE